VPHWWGNLEFMPRDAFLVTVHGSTTGFNFQYESKSTYIRQLNEHWSHNRASLLPRHDPAGPAHTLRFIGLARAKRYSVSGEF
jgi:hypothetical protein